VQGWRRAGGLTTGTEPFFFLVLRGVRPGGESVPALEDMAGERRESFSTAWSAAWVAATSSSIRRLRHSSSYIRISVIRVAQASSQLSPRLAFRTLLRSLPYRVL